MSRHLARVAVGTFILSNPSTLLAGMPSIGLSDIAQLRLQAISFFLVGLLVSAAVIQGLWNWLARDLTALPRLTYRKACAVVVLWGILFVIVLTMKGAFQESPRRSRPNSGVCPRARDARTFICHRGSSARPTA